MYTSHTYTHTYTHAHTHTHTLMNKDWVVALTLYIQDGSPQSEQTECKNQALKKRYLLFLARRTIMAEHVFVTLVCNMVDCVYCVSVLVRGIC